MKSNFKRNLLVGFGVSLVILIISSAASFISISNLLESAELVTHTNEVIRELDEIRSALVDAETGQRGFLLTGEEEFLEPYKDSRARATEALEDIKSMTIDNPAHQSTLAELTTLVDDRFKVLNLSIDAKKENKPIVIGNLQAGREFMDDLRKMIELVKRRENELLAQRTEKMNRFARFTPPLIISAAMIALLITILFYVRVRNDFEERARLQGELLEKDIETSNRISIIQKIADQVSQGRYDIRVNDQQKDALGGVAESLNKMATGLEYSFNLLSDKEWLQTGHASLNDSMIGEKTINTLSKNIIDYLAAYTNSHAAALYILERDELHAMAGYAYVPEKTREKFRIGEGLIGQAVSSGKLIELTEIPADSIYVSFTSGQAKPSHIIAVPIFDGYAIKGAIELASLTGFSRRDVDFLKAASNNIGIALSTAQSRKRLQELLSETQAQSEELKTQHSELENLNSELEVQSEKLQASEEELKVQQEELKQATRGEKPDDHRTEL